MNQLTYTSGRQTTARGPNPAFQIIPLGLPSVQESRMPLDLLDFTVTTKVKKNMSLRVSSKQRT